ncbi:8154_t:CDS:2, partial [Ambispora gerdemannii]
AHCYKTRLLITGKCPIRNISQGTIIKVVEGQEPIIELEQQQRKLMKGAMALVLKSKKEEPVDIEDDKEFMSYYEPEIPFQKVKPPRDVRRKQPIITEENSKHDYPEIFKPIFGVRHPLIKYFESIRRNRMDRWRQRAIIVQGVRYIRELIELGYPIRSIGVTSAAEPPFPTTDKITGATKYVFDHLSQFPAEKYYITDQEMTRKILGQWALMGQWEVYAEVPFPEVNYPRRVRKLLILDKIEDPILVGQLIRAAKALGWDGVFLSPGTPDVYDDRVMRVSRYSSVTFPHRHSNWIDAHSIMTENELPMVVLETLPKRLIESIKSSSKITGKKRNLYFWNKTHGLLENEIAFSSDRIALMISGDVTRQFPEDHIRVTVPTENYISLNPSLAGVILLNEFNRLLNEKKNNVITKPMTQTSSGIISSDNK